MEGAKYATEHIWSECIRVHMKNAHHKTLITGNYNTKDEKQLTYECYKSTRNALPKRFPQQPTLSAMPKFSFFSVQHIII